MKTSSIFFIGMLFTVLLLGIPPAKAQKKQPKPYRKNVTVCFSDGVPVIFSYKGIASRHFHLVNLDHQNDQISYTGGSVDSTLDVTCYISGNYLLKYKDTTVAKFSVRITDSTTSGTLGNRLRLPFNYLIKTKPEKEVGILDSNGKKLFSKIFKTRPLLFFR